MTSERGRISCFVQGARRLNSVLSASAIPFTVGTYQLYQGRSAYNVQSCEIKMYFEDIAQDFDNLCYASYFAELVRYFTRENVEARQELELLYITMLALIRGKLTRKLIRIIFEMRLMQIEGEALEIFHCVKCGKETEQAAIYFPQGGMVCGECLAKHRETDGKQGWKLSRDALYTLQVILTRRLEKLYSFTVSEEVESELHQFMKSYYEYYIHYDFKSLEFLDG